MIVAEFLARYGYLALILIVIVYVGRDTLRQWQPIFGEFYRKHVRRYFVRKTK